MDKVKNSDILLIRRCHQCAGVIARKEEPQRCPHCNKAFLPLDYFGKVHNENGYDTLFSHATELHEEDLIKGLMALW